jgi:DNA-binding CsgD family transcriptional regulator
MEKLIFDLAERRWTLQGSSEENFPHQIQEFDTLLEMFKTGNFFYLLYTPDTNQTRLCSPGIGDILAYQPKDVDFDFLLDLVHPNDQAAVQEFEEAAAAFYQTVSVEERWRYKTRYNFRLQSKYGRFKQFLYQCVPYVMTEEMVEYLCVFTDIDDLKSDTDQHLSLVHLYGGESFINLRVNRKIDPLPDLTRREREVIKSFANGTKIESIAERLHISTTTVKNHLKRVRQKTGAKSNIHLVAMAKEKNWIK